VTASVERIGIFGGTFDPVHLGHLIVASEMRHALALTRVLFVPAGRPPHKPGAPITADAHRVAMLDLALSPIPTFEISRLDLDRAGPSYTADLLTILHAFHSAAELLFLMGADSLRDLPTWHDPARILSLARLGVARRPGVRIDLAAVTTAVPATRGRIHLVDIPLIGISGTDIRRRVGQRRPITFHVPAAVEDYIHAHHLYRPE
jgi:nicotinate-nucleotide adenylyltransferase